jgi:hypothetical protein
MLSRIHSLLRQIAANRSGPGPRRRHRVLASERLESRDLLAQINLTPLADNTIFQDNTSASDGAGTTLFAGVTAGRIGSPSPRRALLQFDVVHSIPAGAHIDSVTLRLNDIKDSFSTSSSDAFGIYLLQASWGEGTSSGTGAGGPASAGDATWLNRFFGPPAQAWGHAGGDFSTTASATTTIAGVGSYTWTSAQLAADVQGWLNNPSTQFGWLLKVVDETAAGTAREFESRQSNFATPSPPTLTINYTPLPVNQQPTLNTISDPARILEDAAQQTIGLAGLSAGSGETQKLTVSATSSNPALIPNVAVNYTSPNPSGSLSYTPVANQSGSAVITVTVQDDGGTANGGIDTITRSFTVRVDPVNDPPTLDAISDPGHILEDAAQQTINLSGITAGPLENQTLSVSATSSDPLLIPNIGVNYSSANSTGSLAYTPAMNRFGTAVITVKVQDDGGTASGGADTITRTFTVHVDGVNDAPTLDPISDPPAIVANSPQQTVDLNGISAGPFESQAITIQATSSNPALIPDPTVNYNSPNGTGSLAYTPVANQTGSATITITLKDDGGTLNNGVDTITRTFNIVVNPPGFTNHAPIFEKGADQSATDEDGPHSVVGWATSISPGSPDEASQTLNFIVTTNNDALFSSKPAIDPTGKLTFTPAPNAHGLVHISVQLHDNGGTSNGGVDTSAAQTFDITITKPHPWHNTAKGEDVNGDTFIAANDALALINRINGFDAGPVPPNAPFGPNYYDANNDGFVAANDVLFVINFINAHPNGQGEASTIDAPAADSLFQQVDALLLLGTDGALQSRRRT